MQFGIIVLVMAATAAGCWTWQRYRDRLLNVGRRSSWLRRMRAGRVHLRDEAWATPAFATAGAGVGGRGLMAAVTGGSTSGGGGAAVLTEVAEVAEEQSATDNPSLGELDALKDELAELLPELRERDDRIVELEQRVAERDERIARLEAGTGASAHAGDLSGRLAERDAMVESLKATVAESRRALQRERDRVSVLEKRREERAREASLLREEVRSLDSAIGHLNERLIAAQQKAKAAQALVESGKAPAAKPNDDAAEAEIAVRDEQIKTLETRLRELQDEVEETVTRYRQREQHIDRLEQNVAAFAKQVHQRDQRVAELVRSLRTAERKGESQAEQARTSASRLLEAQSSLARRDDRIRRLRAAFRASRERIRRAAVVTAADDLKRIRGIGVAADEALREAGITRFEQLAKLSPDDLRERSPRLAAFVERMNRDDWAGQAARLHQQSS